MSGISITKLYLITFEERIQMRTQKARALKIFPYYFQY